MKRINSLIFGVLFVVICSATSLGQSTTTFFTGAHIIPISGDPIEKGVLVIKDGKIVDIADHRYKIPSDAQVVNVSGKVIMPGLVDTHSHIGEGDGGDRSSSLHPDVRILDAIDPRSYTFKRALAGGITSANIMPGSGHLMSGQTVYVKLRKANTIEEMLLVIDEENNIYGDLKMANGTNPIGNGAPPRPGTRAKSAAMARELFIKAQNYQQKIEAADGDESKMPPRYLQMETLVEVLEGKRTVHNHSRRHDDILTAIRLQKEFGFPMVIDGAAEDYLVLDEIKESSHAVFAHPPMLRATGQAKNAPMNLTSALFEADIPFAFQSGFEEYVPKTRVVLYEAAIAAAHGLDPEIAIQKLTIDAAKLLGIADRVGSLERGKDADLALYDGDLFEYLTHVTHVIINGDLVTE